MNSRNIIRTEKRTNINHQSKWFKELAYPRTPTIQPPSQSQPSENANPNTENQQTKMSKSASTNQNPKEKTDVSFEKRLAYLNIESVSHFTRNMSPRVTPPYSPYRTQELTSYFSFPPMNQETFMSKRCYRVNARADKWLKTNSQSNEQYTMTLDELLKATEDLYRERKRIISADASYDFLYSR